VHNNVSQERFYQELGAALRRARRSAGLSIDDLARMVEWHPSEISQVERGRPIMLKWYVALTEALQLGPCNLMKLAAALAAE
jgi:transcriptional regulator with XRE-family HTH domain